MPELPEVEILVRHLRPLIRGKTIRAIAVRRKKVLHPTPASHFKKELMGAKFLGLERRGKFLLFQLQRKGGRGKFLLLGHLGMTGRMFLAPKGAALPKHAAVIFDLGAKKFVYEDPRYFGRLTLDSSAVAKLGPEPWDENLSPKVFHQKLKTSRQPVKVKLLDQSLVAGVGNIYASEALFGASLSPRRAANRLTFAQAEKLLRCVREVLQRAIAVGSTIPLNFSAHKSDGLFYYGSAAGAADFYTERLLVYDRAGKPCRRCGGSIRRIVQAARSTFYCPHCASR